MERKKIHKKKIRKKMTRYDDQREVRKRETEETELEVMGKSDTVFGMKAALAEMQARLKCLKVRTIV